MREEFLSERIVARIVHVHDLAEQNDLIGCKRIDIARGQHAHALGTVADVDDTRIDRVLAEAGVEALRRCRPGNYGDAFAGG